MRVNVRHAGRSAINLAVRGTSPGGRAGHANGSRARRFAGVLAATAAAMALLANAPGVASATGPPPSTYKLCAAGSGHGTPVNLFRYVYITSKGDAYFQYYVRVSVQRRWWQGFGGRVTLNSDSMSTGFMVGGSSQWFVSRAFIVARGTFPLIVAASPSIGVRTTYRVELWSPKPC